MRREGRAGVALSLTLCLVANFRAASADTINGSAHDLSSSGGGEIKSDSSIVCYFCHGVHTPEGEGVIVGYPMWNKDLSDLGPYSVYSSDTLNTLLDQPTDESLACLSCHDGTVALNVIKSGTIGVNLQPVDILTGRDSDLTTDLSNDHPVSFVYDHNVDPGLKPIEQAITAGVKFYGTAENELECGSCHDPHNPQYFPFLRIDNQGSSLCLGCHTK